MKNLAVIPARAGSKRIPRKNIKKFLGKPIIAYSIEIALKSGLFEEVMVSTDDEKIAKVAKDYGAKVPFLRSKKNADDYATLSDVVEEVKSCYLDRNENFDYICCILATAPLIKMGYFEKGYKMILEGNTDAVVPVTEFSYPIQRALKMKDGRLEMLNKEHKRTRSQDLEPAYYDAAQFYWLKFDKCMEDAVKAGLEIPRQFVQDIDNEQDWKIAEIKYKAFFL